MAAFDKEISLKITDEIAIKIIVGDTFILVFIVINLVQKRQSRPVRVGFDLIFSVMLFCAFEVVLCWQEMLPARMRGLGRYEAIFVTRSIRWVQKSFLRIGQQ